MYFCNLNVSMLALNSYERRYLELISLMVAEANYHQVRLHDLLLQIRDRLKATALLKAEFSNDGNFIKIENEEQVLFTILVKQ